MSDIVVVTGGAGFIGSNFVRHLLASSEARIVVFDKLTYAGNLESLASVAANPRFRFVQGDIADRAQVGALFDAHRPSAIVNFAAETHVDRSIDGPRAFIDANVVGTFELLDAAVRLHDSLQGDERRGFRFLHVSTDEVYGSLGAAGAFSETTAYAPRSPYAATKAAADHLVDAYRETYGLPTLTTNCSNNYGPNQYPEKLIPLVITNALEGKPLPIYGDGGNVRDWLFVEDHCCALERVLRAGRVGERYNVGGSNERTNLQIVDAICAALERVMPARENPALTNRGLRAYSDLKTFVADRPGHDRRYAIDATKIRTELGWRPSYDLDAGLLKTVRWYIDNRAWCDSVLSGKYRRERLGLARPIEPSERA
ncbi:MAG: dTDP-glucose 4,6-dehydratase [Polyangiaceae bacterium]